MKKTSVSLSLLLFVLVLLMPVRCSYFTSNTRQHLCTHTLGLGAAATGAARSLTHLGEPSAAIQLTGRHMQTHFKASIHLLSNHLIPRLHTHTHTGEMKSCHTGV